MLRKEIGDLQQQLRESETRNNDLTQNISNATRPLLRQIENLQGSHANQIDLLENSERNLIERLSMY
jgi:TATA element modulatory factor